jgi:hypothetical protein
MLNIGAGWAESLEIPFTAVVKTGYIASKFPLQQISPPLVKCTKSSAW